MMQWFCEPMLCTPRGVRLKPSARKSSAAAFRSRTAMTAWSMPSRSGKRLQETVGRLVADDAQSGNLASLRVEENHARRAEQREALEERAVSFARGGDIRLQQEHWLERSAHARIGERELLHLLAGDAPVRIEVEHDRAARAVELIV